MTASALPPPGRGGAEFRIAPYHGAPTLFINGRPAFYGCWWTDAPAKNGWTRAEFAARNAAPTGIHIYAFDVGTLEWQRPKNGGTSLFDFSTVAARFRRVLAADPQALFHLRIYLEMNEGHAAWWHALYPQELEVVSNGTRHRQSFASLVWRDQVKEFLKGYIACLQKAGLADRIVSYQVGAGHTGEWVKGQTSMSALTGDYSEPMRRHFRGWLKEHYGGDAAALQKAWNDPRVSFDSAEVPSAAAQFGTTRFVFRDPRQEQNVIDYFRCLAELCGDLVVDFCRTVKQASGGRALAGAFYGYLTELAWNAGFFGEGPDSEYSTYQRSGHLGLSRVLASPDVDFLVSPYSYGFRGIGGDDGAMPPADSLRLHNKMYILEDDTRTHTDTDPAYGRARNMSETTALLRRNWASVLTKGQGMWWLVNKGAVDPALDPAFTPLLADFQRLGAWALETDRTSEAEVAVLLDDESFFYETVRNDLDIPLIFGQKLKGLPRMGASYDIFLLDDLLEGRLRPYKLYIFLNAFRLDRNRREALQREIRRDGRTALWVYAPGYIDGEPSLENMTGLTGFRFGRNDHPWPSFMHIVNFDHPATRGLTQDLFWGTDSRLAPMFYIHDDEAVTLGDAVMAQGMVQPGFGVKSFAAWTSIYCAEPDIPAPVLRGIARSAGVPIYSDAGDVLYRSRSLLAVHTVAGGKRTFSLPEKVEVVWDVFSNREVGRDTDSFEVTLPPASTSLYFTGPAKLLQTLVSAGSRKQSERAADAARPSFTSWPFSGRILLLWSP